MTVPDIIKKVFADHPTADFEFKLSATYRKWTYCVQYRETDFNFISRLMEQEGIYYYFRHDKGRHTMVLVDSTSAHTPYGGYGDHSICRGDTGTPGRPGVHRLLGHLARDPAGGVRAGRLRLRAPERRAAHQESVSRTHNEADYEIYDFPGEYLQKGDGDHYTAVRMDELSTQFEIAMPQPTPAAVRRRDLHPLGSGPATTRTASTSCSVQATISNSAPTRACQIRTPAPTTAVSSADDDQTAVPPGTHHAQAARDRAADRRGGGPCGR